MKAFNKPFVLLKVLKSFLKVHLDQMIGQLVVEVLQNNNLCIDSSLQNDVNLSIFGNF